MFELPTCYGQRTSSNLIGQGKEGMTGREALNEAKRLWGDDGTIRLRPPTPHKGRMGPGRLARYRYEVGNGRLGSNCTIMGQGHSWSEAFADARSRG